MAVRFTPLEDDDPKRVAGYELRARLGAGGMGRVYLAFSPGGRALAVKVVRPDYAQDPEFRRRFKREIAAAQRVQGLYTAPVVDADGEAKLPWLATAYVPGPSLQQAVSEHGPLPPLTVLRLLAGVAEGLAAIHACELIHRDLKPANILLADDGPRVIDFGIAHAASATTATSTEVRIGTPAYMAPEQIRAGSASPATDVFALGNLAVHAATGHAAFGEGNSEALFYRIINEEPFLDDCPSEVRDIVERCLAKAPEERPAVDEVMRHARRRTEGETLGLAGSWLPETLAISLAGYDTVKYKKTATTKKAKTAPTKPATTATKAGSATKTTTEPSKKPAKKPTTGPTRTTTKPDAGKAGKTPPTADSSVGSVLGCLLFVAIVVVMAIGPDKVLAWVRSEGKPSGTAAEAGPTRPAPAFGATTGASGGTGTGSDTDTDTGTPTGSGTDTGSDTAEDPTQDETADEQPDGCAQGNRVFSSQTAMYDKTDSATLSVLASNLDAAADAAGDSAVESALRDIADDTRAMSTAQAGVDDAGERRDADALGRYSTAFDSAFEEWQKDTKTFQSLCT
ncbi:serine/threonine-protein kinase [Streptomyces sp. NPDC018610]|uniref:serine/threonine-protein kinase n=1 Tax=Streptomyces sp. NPDC018610 TaxID=3365049 RepID=UPI00379EF543